jgi:hypothetical protein
MKLVLTTLLAGALAAVLLVPAVGAKPGNGNGNGNGPPAWAGGGKGAEASQKKPGTAVKEATHADNAPRTAETAAQKADKATQRAERRAARRAAHEAKEKPANPARACKLEREQLGAEAFAEAYGTNPNRANAFGKCVSATARDRGADEPAGDEGAEAGEEEPAEQEEATSEDEQEEPGEQASIVAFLTYLWPFS